jgi:hypothetical protein
MYILMQAQTGRYRTAAASHRRARTTAAITAAGSHQCVFGHLGAGSPALALSVSAYMPDHALVWTKIGVDMLGHPSMRVEIRVTTVVR